MSPEAISPLRRRMIEDMTIRQFGEHTQRAYIRQVRAFTAFLGRSPDQAEPEDLRRYQLHLASCGASYARMNLASTALRFFFHVTLGRPGFTDRMARIAAPERLPVVLSPEEVALLLAHAPSLKYRAALSIAYGCGLRVSEIVNLKVADIDSARMLIRVEQGKGRKDRYVMLSPDLLELLRQGWRAKRPSTASATTACSPAAPGPPTSPGSGACSARPRPRIRPAPNPPTTSHRRRPAPAAVAASSSSSVSAPGRSRGCAQPQPSGLTRHDRRPAHDRANPIEGPAIARPGSPRPRSRRHP